jgi:hypothetical protein
MPLPIKDRVLQTTVVYDTYWRFAANRQALFVQRLSGSLPPWTDDPVLASYRFTNVYRASDRVSQYLIRNVLYEGLQTSEEIFFRALLFKLFNRVETWEALRDELGEVQWRTFNFGRYAAILDALVERGERLYSAAYIVPPPSFAEARKHRNHLRLIEYMMRDGAPARIERAGSLSEVFEILRSYPSLGNFLSYQFAIDLNYSEIVDFSEMDFVVAGPGARDGIRKCFVDVSGVEEDLIIRAMAEAAPREFERLGLCFDTLWGRPLHLIDCQNLFCEVDKYARVVHPEMSGHTGRQRIKQRFAPKPGELPQWYPPKWHLTPLPLHDVDQKTRTK